MPFYVVEPDADYGPAIPWSLEKEERADSHKTKALAEKAAKKFAENSPGTAFYIVEAIAVVRCEVTKPTIEDLR